MNTVMTNTCIRWGSSTKDYGDEITSPIQRWREQGTEETKRIAALGSTMTKILITSGEYTGRILGTFTLSSDGRYAQANIGRQVVEFKLGYDCKWVRA